MSDKIKYINRGDLPSDYKEMMKTESHHDHKVVYVDGVLRWEVDSFVDALIDAADLNEIIGAMLCNGFDKNSEIYRELYRRMGYSLSGYHDVFYWDMNNENARDYTQPANG